MTEAEARQRAERTLASGGYDFAVRTGRVVETRRAWIFTVEAVDGSVLFGNVPLVVDKKSGAVHGSSSAGIEFVPDSRIPLFYRIARAWTRLVGY
jgi:hypothetical protein